MLEHGKYAQTPLTAVSFGSNERSLESYEMSLGSNENLDAQVRNENLKSANLNDKFSEVFGVCDKIVVRHSKGTNRIII